MGVLPHTILYLSLCNATHPGLEAQSLNKYINFDSKLTDKDAKIMVHTLYDFSLINI